MPSIDYGPFLQAEAYKNQQLTPAMQSMAMMTSLFQNVALPMMQLNMQKDELALQQQNTLVKFDLQRAGMALQRDKMLQDKDIALGQIQMEKDRSASAYGLEIARISGNLAQEAIRSSNANALLEKRMGFEAEQEARGFAMEGWKIEQANILSVRADQRARDSDILNAASESMSLRATARARGDIAIASQLSDDPLVIAGDAVIMKKIGTVTSDPDMKVLKGWFTPEARANTISNPTLLTWAINSMNGASPDQIKQYDLLPVKYDLMERSKRQLVPFLNDIPIPVIGKDGEAIPTSPNGNGKQIIKGSTINNLMLMASIPQMRPDLEAIEKKAIEKAPAPQKVEVKEFFKAIRNGKADFSPWYEGQTEGPRALPGTPSAAALGMVPAAVAGEAYGQPTRQRKMLTAEEEDDATEGWAAAAKFIGTGLGDTVAAGEYLARLPLVGHRRAAEAAKVLYYRNREAQHNFWKPE